MSFFNESSGNPQRRGRRLALLKSNADALKTTFEKTSSCLEDKNKAALSTIKEIIETLENVRSNKDKKLVPPYYHKTMYTPPYYDALPLDKPLEDCKPGRRKKDKTMLKFNGLQDIMFGVETKLKPKVQPQLFPDSPSTDSTSESPPIVERKPPKPRPKRKDRSPPKINQQTNFETVQTQTEMEQDHEYPSHFPKINPISFLPPGTKLCPSCSEALSRGELPPGSLLRVLEDQKWPSETPPDKK